MPYTPATVYVVQDPMQDPIASDFAQTPDYNYVHVIAKDIIGLGENGWGQGSQNSSPVTTRNRVSRTQWANLANDVNFIQQHILASQTVGLTPSTGTAITAALPNAFGTLIDMLAPDRYVCHPSQFYGYPGETMNTLNGTSTRTTIWSKEISQQVRVDWPTNLFAKYFFNAGSVFTWRPTYTSVAVPNDRDAEWAAFIDYLKTDANYEYTRADFLDPTTNTKTTTYTSGTLSVTIVALRNGDINTAKRVDFIATFSNDDVPYLVVDPIHGYWNYGPFSPA